MWRRFAGGGHRKWAGQGRPVDWQYRQVLLLQRLPTCPITQANAPSCDRLEDLASLVYLNESSVLHTLRQRYGASLLHTYAGPSLLVLSPRGAPAVYSEKVWRPLGYHAASGTHPCTTYPTFLGSAPFPWHPTGFWSTLKVELGKRSCFRGWGHKALSLNSNRNQDWARICIPTHGLSLKIPCSPPAVKGPERWSKGCLSETS